MKYWFFAFITIASSAFAIPYNKVQIVSGTNGEIGYEKVIIVSESGSNVQVMDQNALAASGTFTIQTGTNTATISATDSGLNLNGGLLFTGTGAVVGTGSANAVGAVNGTATNLTITGTGGNVYTKTQVDSAIPTNNNQLTNGAGYLASGSNLADLSSMSTARTNLGLGSAATTSSSAFATSAQGARADAALPASGGTSSALVFTGTTRTTGSNDFLFNPNTKQWPTTVIMGDSTSTGDYATSWPSQLHYLEGASLVSTAVSGRTIAIVDSNFNAEVLPYLAPFTGAPALCNLLAGNNDFSQGRTAAQVLSNAQNIVTNVHAAGAKISVMTVLPTSNQPITSSFETNRLLYNSWVLSGSTGADLAIDAASVSGVAITGTTTISGTQYYTLSNYVDGTHPNSTGNGFLAAAYDAAIVGSHLIDVPRQGLSGVSSFSSIPGIGTILNGLNIPRLLALTPMHDYVYGSDTGGDVSGGSGSHGSGVGEYLIQTGTTSGSYNSHYLSLNGWLSTPAMEQDNGVDYSKQITCTTRFYFNTALSSSGTFMSLIGKGSGEGALSQSGFGFKAVYLSGTTAAISVITYDSSLHTSSQLASVIDNTVYLHEISCVSDGAGDVYLFVDGVYSGVATGGPTGNGQWGRYITSEIFNGSDSSNNGIYLHYTRVVVGR